LSKIYYVKQTINLYIKHYPATYVHTVHTIIIWTTLCIESNTKYKDGTDTATLCSRTLEVEYSICPLGGFSVALFTAWTKLFYSRWAK